MVFAPVRLNTMPHRKASSADPMPSMSTEAWGGYYDEAVIRSYIKWGLEIRTGCLATALVGDAGRVTGVVVDDGGAEKRIEAK